MDVVEIKVIDLEISELLAGNWLDAVLLGECTPKLRDDEKILTLYKAFLDGTGETLTSFLLVSVIWR